MRAFRRAACAAAIIMAHMAPTAAEVPASAGLAPALDTGGILGVSAQTGTRLSSTLRLRINGFGPDMKWNAVGQQGLAPATRPRRVATMIDLYPVADSGLRLSAGMRFLARRGRASWTPHKGSLPGNILYAPALAAIMPVRSNVSRTAPAMTFGWTTKLSEAAKFGLEAGTLFEHGGAARSTDRIAQPGRGDRAWSRIDPIAQVALALSF